MKIVFNGKETDLGDATSLGFEHVVEMLEKRRGRPFEKRRREELDVGRFRLRIPVDDGEVSPPPVTVTVRKKEWGGSLVPGHYVTIEEGMIVNATVTDRA